MVFHPYMVTKKNQNFLKTKNTIFQAIETDF